MSSKDDIFQHLKAVLVEEFEVDPAQIVPSAHLYQDLQLDSIDAIDLVVKVQDYTGKKVKPEEFKNARTIADVMDIVSQLLQA
jgi:acyl carrier protein